MLHGLPIGSGEIIYQLQRIVYYRVGFDVVDFIDFRDSTPKQINNLYLEIDDAEQIGLYVN